VKACPKCMELMLSFYLRKSKTEIHLCKNCERLEVNKTVILFENPDDIKEMAGYTFQGKNP